MYSKFCHFINCVSIIHLIVVRYLFNNKQIKKSFYFISPWIYGVYSIGAFYFFPCLFVKRLSLKNHRFALTPATRENQWPAAAWLPVVWTLPSHISVSILTAAYLLCIRLDLCKKNYQGCSFAISSHLMSSVYCLSDCVSELLYHCDQRVDIGVEEK